MNILILFIIIAIVKSEYPTLYEISTRPWLYELSQKYNREITKIKDIPLEEFDTLKTKGINMIWMMGVWQLGQYGLELDKTKDYSWALPDFTEDDVIGSPYAITEYITNSDIGTDEDLKWLKTELNKKGLKLMLDFVPNHSACDCPLVTSNPKLFVRGKESDSYDPKYYLENGVAHGKDPYFDPWADTAQWNYFEEETRKVQTENLKKVAEYADAIRCDMAHLDLNDVFAGTWKNELNEWGYTAPETEFWSGAIKEARSVNPELILLAEVYEEWQMEKLIECGFDYYYDKAFLDKCKGGPSEVNAYVKDHTLEFFHTSAHMVENHDEERAVKNMGSIARSNAAGAMAATLPGLRFFNHGQFDGLQNKLDVHLRRSNPEKKSLTAQSFYASLLNIIQDEAFTSENIYYVNNITGDSAGNFASWIRKATNSYLVVVNYGDSYACANVPIHDIEGSGDIHVKEVFTNVEYTRNAETIQKDGLNVCLDAFGVQIFQYNY